jgi:hypothetical protein
MIHSPTPRRAWEDTITWLGRDVHSPVLDDPIPPEVLELIDTFRNLPDIPFSFDHLDSELVRLLSAISETVEPSMDCPRSNEKRTVPESQDEIGQPRRGKRRRLGEAAIEADETHNGVKSACIDQLRYRVLQHIFPQRDRQTISSLFVKYAPAAGMLLALYCFHALTPLLETSIQCDHRVLTEQMVKLREESLRLLRNKCFGSSNARYSLLPYKTNLNGDMGQCNAKHIDFLINPEFFYRFFSDELVCCCILCLSRNN